MANTIRLLESTYICIWCPAVSSDKFDLREQFADR